MPPMRGCDAACPQAPASAAAVWAGRPLMRRLRIRRNRRTRARSPTTEVASTDARRTNFPVSCRHSRTPIIRHGRPAKDEADLWSLRGAHEARQATALARPQTPRGPPVSVHRLRACRHGRVARAGGRIVEAKTPALAQGARQRGLTGPDRLTPQVRAVHLQQLPVAEQLEGSHPLLIAAHHLAVDQAGPKP